MYVLFFLCYSQTRSSSDMDGENYCNISAEDVKTEIVSSANREIENTLHGQYRVCFTRSVECATQLVHHTLWSSSPCAIH